MLKIKRKVLKSLLISAAIIFTQLLPGTCSMAKPVATDLGTLGGSSSIPVAINEKGQVVGYSFIKENQPSHAFIWENGKMTDLGTFGEGSSSASAINEKGQVSGQSNRHGFIWEDGKMTDLGPIVQETSTVINEKGQVGGTTYTAEGRHAFICQGSPESSITADSWAQQEIQKASTLDLIPQILNDVDLTKPISREEFCELSVRLYEKMTGKQAAPTFSNPFNDTNNTQILKAYALGITTGTSAVTFDPGSLINREQCAVMLFRTIKLAKPTEDYSAAGIKDFADQRNISVWAVDATKYMFKIGLIKGDANNNFMPKPVTEIQKASGYGMAKREEAILMSERTYEKLSN